MSMQVTWLEQTRSCMLLTSEDPESSGPLRIVTEELARVKSRQQDIVSIAKKKKHKQYFCTYMYIMMYM